MGWFDSDKGEKDQTPAASSPQPQPARTAVPAPPAREPQGSTLGRNVHVNGTIVSEEPLRVLGRVEGTIRAREDLSIAKGAEVKAVIYGRRVHVEGSVKGDVHATEQLVLGSTAVLEGNIGTPSLQIQEGAFFKGTVEMRTAEASQPAKPAGKPSSPTHVGAGKSSGPKAADGVKPSSPKSADGGDRKPAAVTGSGEDAGKAGAEPREPEKTAAGGAGRSGS